MAMLVRLSPERYRAACTRLLSHIQILHADRLKVALIQRPLSTMPPTRSVLPYKRPQYTVALQPHEIQVRPAQLHLSRAGHGMPALGLMKDVLARLPARRSRVRGCTAFAPWCMGTGTRNLHVAGDKCVLDWLATMRRRTSTR